MKDIGTRLWLYECSSKGVGMVKSNFPPYMMCYGFFIWAFGLRSILSPP